MALPSSLYQSLITKLVVVLDLVQQSEGNYNAASQAGFIACGKPTDRTILPLFSSLTALLDQRFSQCRSECQAPRAGSSGWRPSGERAGRGHRHAYPASRWEEVGGSFLVEACAICLFISARRQLHQFSTFVMPENMDLDSGRLDAVKCICISEVSFCQHKGNHT